MAWKMYATNTNPMQNWLVLVNDDPTATPTTEYHKADGIARRFFGEASLSAKGYQLMGNPERVYVSQAY